jgi:hypothetical protein
MPDCNMKWQAIVRGGHIRDLADGSTRVCLDNEFEVHHEITGGFPIADEILADPYRRVWPGADFRPW